MINPNSGTPFVGYVSLTNGAIGPTNFAIFTVIGAAAYTLQSTERLVITNITVSSSDTIALLTVDSGGTTPTKFYSGYVQGSVSPHSVNIPPGVLHGIFGTLPRAIASAVSATKTIECIINGFITRS